jgi:DNA-binding CsgD family transcriptional regulator
MNSFINQTTIPFLQMLIGAGEHIILHDIDNKIIFSTDKVCQFVFNLPFSEVKGKSILAIYNPADENMHIIDKVRNYTKISNQSVTCLRTPSKVYPQTFTKPNSEHQQQFPLFSIKISPVVDDTGTTVATFSIYQLFNNYDLFYSIYYTKLNNKDRELNLPRTELTSYNLSKRELEILYLLSQNLSQREIAQLLDITRGTVTKILTEKIYTKLNIPINNNKHLIQRAIELGINENVPQSLVPDGVILSCNNKIKHIVSKNVEIKF